MKNTYLYSLLVILTCFIGESFACDCVHSKRTQSLNNSEIVVRATILKSTDKIDDIDSSLLIPHLNTDSIIKGYSNEYGYNVDIKIERTIKGVLLRDTIEVKTGHMYNSCSYRFRIGHTYMVFMSKQDGEYHSDQCSGNFDIKDKEKLKEFKTTLTLFSDLNFTLNQTIHRDTWELDSIKHSDGKTSLSKIVKPKFGFNQFYDTTANTMDEGFISKKFNLWKLVRVGNGRQLARTGLWTSYENGHVIGYKQFGKNENLLIDIELYKNGKPKSTRYRNSIKSPFIVKYYPENEPEKKKE